MTDEKYFVLLIHTIESPLEFSILRSLSNSTKDLSTEEKNILGEKLGLTGVSRGYFKVLNKDTGWYSLTEKGINLKDFEKGYVNYEELMNKKDSELKNVTINAENVVMGDNHGSQSTKKVTNNVTQKAIPKKDKTWTISKFMFVIISTIVAGVLLFIITSYIS